MAKGKAREVQPHYRRCGKMIIYFQDYHHIYLDQGINKFRITPMFKENGVIRNWRHMWDMLHSRKPMDMDIAIKTVRKAGYYLWGVRTLPDFGQIKEIVPAQKGKDWYVK